MRRKKALFGRMTCVILLVIALASLAACGDDILTQSSNEMLNNTAGNIFAESNDFVADESDTNCMSITVALPAYTLPTESNQWYDRLVADIAEYTKMDVTWIWYDAMTHYEQIEQDILAGEVADIILTDRRETFLNAAEEGLFWEIGPYIDNYENLATMLEISRLAASYNGKMYGIARPRTIDKGLGYRTDWQEKLNLEEPSDWQKFYNMLYAFTYGDPDGNGVDDTVGLYMDSRAELWDVMESWFGVPDMWGIDENGDLIHKSRTEEYRDAYTAFRKLYGEGLINNGSNGFADFRDTRYAIGEGFKTSLGGSAIDTLTEFHVAQSYFVEQGISTEEELIFNLQAYVDTGYGALCYPVGGGGSRNLTMLAISTKRIKTEEQLERVLQFLNDVNNAECYNLIQEGWIGETYQIDENGLKQEPWRLTQEQVNTGVMKYRAGFNRILTNHVAEENKSNVHSLASLQPVAKLAAQLQEEYELNCVINYGMQFLPETEKNQGAELEAMLYDAEIQYITGEIDDAGFEAALNAWWEAGGEKMTEEINELYHAAGY